MARDRDNRFSDAERPCVRLRQTANQTIPTGTGSATYFTWGAVDWMRGNMWVSTDNTKITIPVSGLYLLSAGFVFGAAMPAGSYVEWGIHGPNSATNGPVGITDGTSEGAWMAGNMSGPVYATKGDYFRLAMKQNSGTDKTTYYVSVSNFFSAIYLGGLAV